MDAATGIALAGVGVTVVGMVGNALLFSRAQGKHEGVIKQTLDDIERRLERNDTNQDRQWAKLDDHEQRISTVEGILSINKGGKAHSAHS